MLNPGNRVEIPVHYDLWMRGARYGTVTKICKDDLGGGVCAAVKMDNQKIKRLVYIPRHDWESVKII